MLVNGANLRIETPRLIDATANLELKIFLSRDYKYIVGKIFRFSELCDPARSDPSPSAFPPEGAFWEQEGASLGSRSDPAREVHLGIKKRVPNGAASKIP